MDDQRHAELAGGLEMTPKEKIAEWQRTKEELYPTLVTAAEKKNAALKEYQRLKAQWTELNCQYEELDRKEKLATFKMNGKPTLKPSKAKKTKKNSKQSAEAKALAALKDLPPAVREKVMAAMKGSSA